MTRKQAEKLAEILDSVLMELQVPSRSRAQLQPEVVEALLEAFPNRETE